MSGGGWVKAHRAMRDHPMLHNAVRKGVWLDLLLMAAHEPTRVILRGRAVNLQPGQCAFVVSDWAKSLGLTPRQIERIVDSFVSENAVSKASASGKAFTIITLCNYGKYQASSFPRGERVVEETGEARGKGGGSEQEPEEPKESKNKIPPDGGPSPNGRYRWQGDIIRLTEADYTRWVASFTHLDLPAELASLDAWLQSPDATDDNRKRWFHVVAGALKNRNNDAAAKKRIPSKGRIEFGYGAGIS